MEGVTGSIPVAPTILLSEFVSTHLPGNDASTTMASPQLWLLLVVAGGAAGVMGFRRRHQRRSAGSLDRRSRRLGAGRVRPALRDRDRRHGSGQHLRSRRRRAVRPILAALLDLTGGTSRRRAGVSGRALSRPRLGRKPGRTATAGIMHSVDAEGWHSSPSCAWSDHSATTS